MFWMWLWRAAVYAACQAWKCCETCWDFLSHPLDYDWTTQCLSLWSRRWGQTVTFRDTGDGTTVVRVGREIAQGGFSYIYVAHVVSTSSSSSSSPKSLRLLPRAWQAEATTTMFALKRIHCGDDEMMQACREEAKVHRAFDASGGHANIMPLLGFSMETANGSGGGAATCFMLFPLLSRSLRDEITQRNLLQTDPHVPRRPWSEVELLPLFASIVLAVHAMHQTAGYAHCDVKVENVMLTSSGRPVLMDFGSAQCPLQRALTHRPQVMQLVETAATHTTISYRPPELFEGEWRLDNGAEWDYAKVDVWSLGCLLFALQFGASPFELEFVHNTATGGGGAHIRIVDCSHLRVLGPIPKPPAGWYSQPLMDLVTYMLHPEPRHRPTMTLVLQKLDTLWTRDLKQTSTRLVPPATTTTLSGNAESLV